MENVKKLGRIVVASLALCGMGLLDGRAAVVEFDLSGVWRLSNATNDEQTCIIDVPGGVHTALLKSGLMKNPFWGRNELETQWVAKEDWVIERKFIVSPDLLSHASVILRLEDCDTFCTVYVNGQKVGVTSDRFCRWDFDVKPYLKAGRNVIRGVFASAWRVADEKAKTQVGKCHMSNVPWCKNQALIRKPACHAGWDWGLAQMITGFCGPVKLIASDNDRIDYVYTTQKWKDDLSHCTLEVVADMEDGTQERRTIEIENPPLWWPNGTGEQRFYTYTVEIRGQKVTRSIGLRKLEVVTKDGAMTFRVNNRDLFMKGANWIPCSAFENEQTEARYRDLLESAAAANMNMIRVWGGGQYERDEFYNLCDRLGLLIWHDQMFSCAIYPSDDAFLADVEREYAHQFRRLRDHASIALWCGDNECVGALSWFGDSPDVVEVNRRNLEKRQSLTAAAVARYDPTRTFWPSSPCAGPGDYSDAWHDDSKGDMHNWTVWHENKSFDNYYLYRPRFCSEFGYQSFPSREVAETFCRPEDVNLAAPDFAWHQKNPGGNARIVETMARYFRTPKDVDAVLYLSQVQQAMAIKTAVEGWRAQRPRCMGTLFWQLNDNWPVASWSSIEYGGKWKPLQYQVRRFFAPLAVVGVPGVNGGVKVVAISDLNEKVAATVTVEYWDFSGKVLETWKVAAEIAPDSVQAVGEYPVRENAFLVMTLESPKGGRFVNDWFFGPYKNYDLDAAKIAATIEPRDNPSEFAVTLTTERPAFFVWMNARGIRGEFTDNSLTLLPGHPRHLRFRAKEGVEIESFRRAFSVTSLRESYANP